MLRRGKEAVVDEKGYADVRRIWQLGVGRPGGDALFSESPITDEQFDIIWRGVQDKKKDIPECILMLKVLEDALWQFKKLFKKLLSNGNPRARSAYWEIHRYFFNRNNSWLFSFQRICEELDIDADNIRKNLLKYRRKIRQEFQSK